MGWYDLPGVTSSSFAQNPVSASSLEAHLQSYFETRLEPEFIWCICNQGICKYVIYLYKPLLTFP